MIANFKLSDPIIDLTIKTPKRYKISTRFIISYKKFGILSFFSHINLKPYLRNYVSFRVKIIFNQYHFCFLLRSYLKEFLLQIQLRYRLINLNLQMIQQNIKRMVDGINPTT